MNIKDIKLGNQCIIFDPGYSHHLDVITITHVDNMGPPPYFVSGEHPIYGTLRGNVDFLETLKSLTELEKLVWTVKY